MKHRTIAALATAIGLAGAALFAGCSEDPQIPPHRSGPAQTTGSFENLTEQWHPLNNLEVAYEQRNIDRYRQALDPDHYTFFFSPADFSSGKTDEYWDYTVDTWAAERMFDPQLPDISKRAVILEFDLVFDKDALTWNPVQPDSTPSETWHETTVGYTYFIALGDGVRAYVQPPGASVTITVRQDPDDDLWRIAEITDLPGTAQNAPSIPQLAQRRVEESSLGQIKALYAPRK
jgi:hypothetical protein